jgi:hypothetical protein
MPWIAALALMMVAMLISSVIGAEVNYRRNLDRRARLAERHTRAARGRALAAGSR